MFDRSMLIMDNYLDQLRQKSFQDLNDNIIKLKNYISKYSLLPVLVPGDFDHSGTGEKSQKVTRENDQKSHLTPLIIRFPEDCQKQFLPFL